MQWQYNSCKPQLLGLAVHMEAAQALAVFTAAVGMQSIVLSLSAVYCTTEVQLLPKVSVLTTKPSLHCYKLNAFEHDNKWVVHVKHRHRSQPGIYNKQVTNLLLGNRLMLADNSCAGSQTGNYTASLL